MALATLSIDLVAKLASFERDLQTASTSVDKHVNTMVKKFGLLELAVKSVGGGFVLGLTLDKFKGKIEDVINSAAGLKDMSERTGASVEQLSALAGVAKMAGADTESLAGGLQKLAKTLVDAKSGGEGSTAAFRAIGISVKDLKGLNPADAFKLVAEKLNLYEDGADKVAVAQALLGKSGANLLPTMKELADAGELQAKVTAEQASIADEYQKNTVKLNAAQGALYKIVAMEIMPAMNIFSEVMLKSATQTDGVKGAVKSLADDHSIRDFSQNVVVGMTIAVESVAGLAKTVRAIGGSFESVWADLTVAGTFVKNGGAVGLAFESSRKELSAALDLRNKTVEKANKRYVDLWNYDGSAMSRELSDRFAKYNAGIRPPEQDTPKKKPLRFGGLDDDSGKSAAKAAQRMAEDGAKLAISLSAVDAQLAPDFFEKWDKLSAAYKGNKISLDDLTVAQANLLRTQPIEQKALKAAQQIAEERQRLRIKEDEEIAAFQAKTLQDETSFWANLIAATPTAKLEEQRALMMRVADGFLGGKFGDPATEEAAKKYSEVVTTILGTAGDAVVKLDGDFAQLGKTLTSSLDNAIASGGSLRDVLQGLAADVLKISFHKIVSEPLGNMLSKSLDGFSLSSLSSLFGFRASGGPVTGNSPYIVGEKGPELFVPNGSGTIVPNHALSAGGGQSVSIVIHNTIGSVASQVDVVQGMRTVRAQIMSELSRGSRMGGAFA